eukprot:403365832
MKKTGNTIEEELKSQLSSQNISITASKVSLYEDERQKMKDKIKLQQSKSIYDEDSDGGSESGEEDEMDIVIKSDQLIFNPESSLRGWLKKHGKSDYIDFDDTELKQLRQYFDSLDDDASGSIGVEELEGPLIALGLVENREQVQQIVDLVDEDGSNKIEFDEFLSIIKGGSNAKEGNEGTGAIYQFFKNLTSGQLTMEENPNIPFQLFISSYRRRKILDAMMNKDKNKRDEGEKILNNYRKQIAERDGIAQNGGKTNKNNAGNTSQLKGGNSKPSNNRGTLNSSGFGKSQSQNSQMDFATSIGMQSTESYDPEILLKILNKKSNY